MFSKFKKKSNSVNLNRIERSVPVDLRRERAPVFWKKRQSPRKPAWAVCQVWVSPEECREGIIIDISSTGLRVRFDRRSGLPGRVVVKSSRHRLNRMAQTVWQDGSDVGFHFTG